MEPATWDDQVDLRIGHALRDRLTPIACQIVRNIVDSTKMIDTLSAVVIAAMLDYSHEQHRNDHPHTDLERAYKNIRAAYLQYGEVALREATLREEHNDRNDKQRKMR
jgi:hypothetical protein